MTEPKDFSSNYAKSIQDKFSSQPPKGKYTNVHTEYMVEVVAGKVYDKLVMNSRTVVTDDDGNVTNSSTYNGGGVHAFVVRETGDLVKAATWFAPQKSKSHPSGLAVRFNIATPVGFRAALDAANFHGSYLYAH